LFTVDGSRTSGMMAVDMNTVNPDEVADSHIAEPGDAAQGRLVLGTTPRQWAVLGVALALIAGLAGGLALGRAIDPVKQVSNEVDVGFARDMGVHHAQAVEMASIAYLRTSDEKLRYIAFDIMTTQQGQIGTMHGWLQLWKQTVSDSGTASMAWMGEPHDGAMPGMATGDEVASLRTLPTSKMEEQFLRLMIRHHRGALPMADYAAKHATSSDIRDLARKMSAGQSAEIDLLQSLLTARGLDPEPESAMAHGAGHEMTPDAEQSPSGTPSSSATHGGHG
jgi:uncharacterized protein (DUF305 family)